MAKFKLTYVPRGTIAHEAALTDGSVELHVQAARANVDEVPPTPEFQGDHLLTRNLALVSLLSAWLHTESQARRSRSQEKRERHEKDARALGRDAVRLAEHVLDAGSGLTTGWCSVCLIRTMHRGEDRLGIDTYICESCGSATTQCGVPRCPHFAARGSRKATTPRFCAEHVHAIPAFEKLDSRLADLSEWESWHQFESVNVKKLVTAGFAVSGVAVLTAITLGAAAPAIGGAIGHAATAAGTGATLTGAAASSHGLALLGFGSIASGGLGMAGGTAVITAAGGALGARSGLRLATAYGKEDPSFGIHPIRPGTGGPIIVANGFTTEGRRNIDDWLRLIDTRYPDRPVYHLHWGAKELKQLGTYVLGDGAAKGAVSSVAGVIGKKASKLASRSVTVAMGPLGALSIARNPWTVAYRRAINAGYALADILARTDGPAPVLMGHSLGGRAMAAAATLAGTSRPGSIEAVHVVGAAIPADEPWKLTSAAVSEGFYNYWSSNDGTLATMFRAGQFGAKAVGHVGISSGFPRIKDVNVSRRVAGHTKYLEGVASLKTP
jgi:hypothetical protein